MSATATVTVEEAFAFCAARVRAHYENFSTLVRSSFDQAVSRFNSDSIDLLHLDGLHTEAAVRHDVLRGRTFAH